MLWVIIIGIFVLVILPSLHKKKKAELNDEDLLLFEEFKSRIKSKILTKRPDDLTEWEKSIWIMASNEVADEGNKKMYQIFGIIFLAIIVIIIATT